MRADAEHHSQGAPGEEKGKGKLPQDHEGKEARRTKTHEHTVQGTERRAPHKLQQPKQPGAHTAMAMAERERGHEQRHTEVYTKTRSRAGTGARKREVPSMGRRAQQQASQGQQRGALGKHNKAEAVSLKRGEEQGEAHPQRQAGVHMEEAHQTGASAHSEGEQCKGGCKHPQALKQGQKELQKRHMEHGATGSKMSETRNQAHPQKHRDEHSAAAHSKGANARSKEAPNMEKRGQQQGSQRQQKKPQKQHMLPQTADQKPNETETCAHHQKRGEEYTEMH